jgi:TolB-like protein/tetratricopeptide (TPR) repeat protein
LSDDPREPAVTKPATLFLSYSRADRVVAEKLGNALKNAGFEVWWDALIEGGAVFTKSIETALNASDVVIVLWSQSSVQSDWVRDEAGRGRDRKRLVPVSLDGTEPPLGFQQYHAIDLTGWRGHGDEAEFVSLLQSISTTSGQPVALPSKIRPKPVVGRRGLIIGGLGATAIATGSGGFWAWKSGVFGPGPALGSIAVLPFKNLSGDPAQLYFSDGLTEEVRAALMRNNALQVLAATSSETARDHKDDAKTIARKLGVAFLLEGSIRRAGDVVRIAAELTDGKTGFSKWSNTLDRSMADIFAVQSELARTVTEALSVTMATAAPAPGGTKNVAAYEAFLKGRAVYADSSDEAGERAAVVLFDQALSADPKFADAHSMRSHLLRSIASQYATGEDLPRLYDASIAAAQTAVSLAPDLADAQMELAEAIWTARMSASAARPYFDKGYALGRGDANIALVYARFCARAGRDNEAREAIARARALDSLNARVHRVAGIVNYAARRYADALPPLRRALALKPTIGNGHYYLGAALYQFGQFAEARTAFIAEPQPLFGQSGLAIVEHRLGNVAAAKAAMARLIKDSGDAGLYQQAEVLAQWGQIDDALTTLERARDARDAGLTYMLTDPMLDPLRKSPRFAALLKVTA